jgi:hypothetical protein
MIGGSPRPIVKLLSPACACANAPSRTRIGRDQAPIARVPELSSITQRRTILSMKTRMTVSLDADIAERIRRLAEGEGQDVSPWLNDFVRRHTEIAELREVADQLRAVGVDSGERWERRAQMAAAARAEFARTEGRDGLPR